MEAGLQQGMAMRALSGWLVIAGIGLLAARPAEAVTIISSTFDVNDEGWTSDPGEAAVTYEATGGNPGGFLRLQDTGPTSYVAYPPAKFKGNLLAYDGGMLTYQVRDLFRSEPPSFVDSGFGRVQLNGGGSNATFDYVHFPPIPAPLNPSFSEWTTYFVPMTPEAWHTTPENWQTVLSDVTIFHVTLNLEDIGLDNFQLAPVPEPSSLLLLGSGLLGLVGIGLQRRKRLS